MKHLLRALAARNLLIAYTVGMYTGQRLRVWGPDGLPRTMSPGTARACQRGYCQQMRDEIKAMNDRRAAIKAARDESILRNKRRNIHAGDSD